jgi:hypothetical protein
MKSPVVLAGVLARLCAVLLLTTAGQQVRAQTTGAINPGDRTEPAAKDEPPPGGCMPIGVTASGEVVFPFLCKGFIEQHKAANHKPTEASEKPVAGDGPPSSEDKRAATPPEDIAPKAAPAAEAAKEAQGAAPAAAEEQRAATDTRPREVGTGADDKSAMKQPEADAATTATVTPAPEPATPSREPRKPGEGKAARPAREGRAGPPGCTRFRSYDASSGTYVDYSGRRQACRS